MYRIGLLAYPLFVLVLVLQQREYITSAFLRHGAVSPGTARKPQSVGVNSLRKLRRAVQKGAIIPVRGGRYYVNMPRHHRRVRLTITSAAAVTVSTIALALLLWHPWTHLA